MKRLVLITLAAMCCFVVLSCQKRYVGQSVDYSWDGWCQYAAYYNNSEKHCTVDSGALIFDFTIRKGEKDGEYIIEGFVDPTKGDLKSWDKMSDGSSRFSMIVAHAGKVIDNVAFRPQSAFGDMGTQWPFRIDYMQPEGFDAVTFTWNIQVRGQGSLTELNLVFPNGAGQPLNHNNMINRHFVKGLENAELETIRFHDLRHTYASLLIEQGENIKYIQTQLGHSSPTVTLNVYAHLMKDTNQGAAKGLEKAVFGKDGDQMETKTKQGATV